MFLVIQILQDQGLQKNHSGFRKGDLVSMPIPTNINVS